MGFYDRVIFPRLMHIVMGFGELPEYRRKVVPAAEGRVLEIGIGSGLNAPLYTDRVSEVIGLDPNETLNRMARERVAKARVPIRVLNGSAEDMPLDDSSFDTVVMTWTLCSIPNPVRALREMRRVLRPGGQLLFIEHGAAPDPGVARWQDRLTPAWKRVAGGCHLNRPMDRLIREGGFTLTDLETGYLEGPRFAAYNYWGRATA